MQHLKGKLRNLCSIFDIEGKDSFCVITVKNRYLVLEEVEKKEHLCEDGK